MAPSFRDVAGSVARGDIAAVKAALAEKADFARASEVYDEVMETLGDDDTRIAMAPVSGTLLSIAAKHGRDDIVALLLEGGADANGAETVRWQSGSAVEKRTPLELAVWSGSAESVKLLLDHGAEVAAVCKPDVSGDSAFEEATGRGLTDIAQSLLGSLKKSNVILGPEMMDKLLLRAIQAQSKDMVEMFLDYGADVNGGGSSGSRAGVPPLRVAARYRSPEIVSLLISRGAEASVTALAGPDEEYGSTASLLELAASVKAQLAEWSEAPGLPEVERDWRRQLQAKHEELIKVLVASEALKVEPGSIGHCLDLFRRFDLNGNGVIERSELQRVMRRIDESRWTEERVDQLIKAADANRDGMIQLEEFLTYVFGTGKHAKSTAEAADAAAIAAA